MRSACRRSRSASSSKKSAVASHPGPPDRFSSNATRLRAANPFAHDENELMSEETNPTKPIYVCQGFPVGGPEHEAAQAAWLESQASRGYRLVDRKVFSSGGASKRVHLVMELLEPLPIVAREGGA